jgi:hypothetical protein
MAFEPNEENDLDLSFVDSVDVAILMHRDVHFGGQFDFMVEYYEKGGKGVNQEFDIERIKALMQVEKQMKQNLAPLLLSGVDAEKIAKAKEAYKKLRDLYQYQRGSKAHKYPLLIADLILTEDEEATNEIAAVVAEKGTIVPALIQLIRSEDLYDSLFPGYGEAPTLAIKCLGLIGDKRAIISLFESIGEGDFMSENLALDALKAIGAPAKEFLMKVLHAQPITYDNERAALALDRFKDDPEVASNCFAMLKSLDFKKNSILADYLVLACEGLSSQTERKEFLKLAELPAVPPTVQQDIRAIAKEWK